MNSADLMFFAAVAEAGGITRAAAALNTVQSNVTGRIRALEQSLHTPLFYRESRGVSLTKAGQRLLPYARQVARLLSDAEQAVLSDEIPRGTLRLGSMETTAGLRLPKLLASYASACAEVNIDLELGPTEALLTAVLDRRVEGAFVSGPVNQDDLVAVPVLKEELVLVSEAKVQTYNEVVAMLASKREVRVLVFRTGCTYRQRLESFLVTHGLMHVPKMEFGTLDGILGCIEAGMGMSMLPRAVAAPLQEAGRVSIHALPEGAGIAQTMLVYRKDSLLTAAFKHFLEQACATFA
ncbi:LysR family transcriptional regulator [Rhizobium sp. P44RR-XXIV]|uniref:LysR family transcriptional regulator n=1 Tax=Rhizobium sp. P44RR-XXIV TaxID=1921145 RepID=UPI00098548DD|nr:LysR family transcriptional regulator [Rhizobium sp. P44RR-XXIV]TIX90692.1 LysR family transcriptional regulator [Rhizobium sp. P44RR-XXIV]